MLFKRDVRTLKTLAIPESLDVGHRLTARGSAYLRAPAR
jgi:hypothetical protein